jgi:hypothetical protein
MIENAADHNSRKLSRLTANLQTGNIEDLLFHAELEQLVYPKSILWVEHYFRRRI